MQFEMGAITALRYYNDFFFFFLSFVTKAISMNQSRTYSPDIAYSQPRINCLSSLNLLAVRETNVSHSQAPEWVKTKAILNESPQFKNLNWSTQRDLRIARMWSQGPSVARAEKNQDVIPSVTYTFENRCSTEMMAPAGVEEKDNIWGSWNSNWMAQTDDMNDV